MGKNKKEKLPPTKEQMIANDPLWDKIFKLRLNGQNDEAERLKQEILSYYK
jgi:hypothetical protein